MCHSRLHWYCQTHDNREKNTTKMKKKRQYKPRVVRILCQKKLKILSTIFMNSAHFCQANFSTLKL